MDQPEIASIAPMLFSIATAIATIGIVFAWLKNQ